MGERQGEMTAKAAHAFGAYVAMGPSRSLRSLARVLTEQGLYKNSTAALRVLGKWSSEFRWQQRLAAAVTAETEARLARAAEIDAASFLRTSKLIAERLSWADAGHVDAVIKMREAVRRPDGKPGGALNVNLQVTIRAIVERVAAEQGLDPDEVLAEAESILAGA